MYMYGDKCHRIWFWISHLRNSKTILEIDYLGTQSLNWHLEHVCLRNFLGFKLNLRSVIFGKERPWSTKFNDRFHLGSTNRKEPTSMRNFQFQEGDTYIGCRYDAINDLAPQLLISKNPGEEENLMTKTGMSAFIQITGKTVMRNRD